MRKIKEKKTETENGGKNEIKSKWRRPDETRSNETAVIVSLIIRYNW